MPLGDGILGDGILGDLPLPGVSSFDFVIKPRPATYPEEPEFAPAPRFNFIPDGPGAITSEWLTKSPPRPVAEECTPAEYVRKIFPILPVPVGWNPPPELIISPQEWDVPAEFIPPRRTRFIPAGPGAVSSVWFPRPRIAVAPLEQEVPGARRLRYKPDPTITAAYTAQRYGRFRIANAAVEGYVVYVGYGAMPDFTVAPAGFGAALPVAFAITPPGVGTQELWVVTRKRNAYGVESQNTHPQKINIDTAGNEVLGTLTAPVINTVISVEDEKFRVFAQYPGFNTDTDPADTWRVYVGAGVAPVPGVDVPAAEGSMVSSDQAGINVGPYATGGITYYFAVTVVRAADSEESAAATFILALDADPAPVVPVHGGFVAE